MSNLANYKLKKMEQLKSNLERSSRLINTINGINRMKGGETSWGDLNNMIGDMKSQLASKGTDVEGEFVISQAQLDSAKTFIDKSKETIGELVKLAKEEALSQGKKQYKPVPETFMKSMGLPDTLMDVTSPTTEMEPLAPVVANRPPVVANRPPVVANRPPVVANRPPVVANRPPVVANRPPVVPKPTISQKNAAIKSADQSIKDITKAIKKVEELIKNKAEVPKNTQRKNELKAHLAYSQAMKTAKGDYTTEAVKKARESWEKAKTASRNAGNIVSNKYQRWGWWD
jgi:hypothetical protein